MINWEQLLHTEEAAEFEPPKPVKGKSVEAQYAELIKAGQVRIVRRKGRPPKVVFLSPK